MERFSSSLVETIESLQRDDADLFSYYEEIKSRVDRVDDDIESLVPEPDRWGRVETEIENLNQTTSNADFPPVLYGVPVGIKDIFHVDGLPTRAGSDLPQAELTGPEAEVVTLLRDAGAVVLGKTVTTEFACSPPGPTRNPHDLNHTPGGSSSGSAAAVAAGLCPLALGSQTIGSVIRPAAYCGVVGFKPSYGRVPIDGVIPAARSVDHVGMFTQDVASARYAAGLLCRNWRAYEPSDDPIAVGVPTGPYLDQASNVGREAFETQLRSLEAAGLTIRRVPMFEEIDRLNETHFRLVRAEAALAHAAWFERYGDRYHPKNAQLIRDGREVDVGIVCDARNSRSTVRRYVREQMETHELDLIVCPAATGPAPSGLDNTGDPAMNIPWTHGGVPVATVPGGRVAAGLPVGLQCIAPFGRDEELVRHAQLVEGILDNG